MSFLSYLGLDDLADDIREFTDGLDALKQDVITSVIGPGEELKNTVSGIVESVTTQVQDTKEALTGSAERAVDGVKKSVNIDIINK